MPKEITYRNEADVKKRVKKLLDQRKWFWWMPAANAYGKAGVADVLALRGGVFLAVETKFGTNKPTAMQVGFLNSVNAESGFGFVVSDRNIQWFESWLEAFDNASQAVATNKSKSPEEAVAPEDGAMMINAIRAMTELLV